MNKLFVFSAPSGSGKTTIVRSVLKEFPNMVFSISATTRKVRGPEKDSVDYFFISEEDFKNKIEANEFIEWEKFYDYYYGTLKKFVEDKLKDGKSIALEVDVKGALKIKKDYNSAVLIFIMPPSFKVMKERLINRKTDSEQDLMKRLERAEMELAYKDYFDYRVINNDLNEAKSKVLKIIKEELNKEK